MSRHRLSDEQLTQLRKLVDDAVRYEGYDSPNGYPPHPFVHNHRLLRETLPMLLTEVAELRAKVSRLDEAHFELSREYDNHVKELQFGVTLLRDALTKVKGVGVGRTYQTHLQPNGSPCWNCEEKDGIATEALERED